MDERRVVTNLPSYFYSATAPYESTDTNSKTMCNNCWSYSPSLDFVTILHRGRFRRQRLRRFIFYQEEQHFRHVLCRASRLRGGRLFANMLSHTLQARLCFDRVRVIISQLLLTDRVRSLDKRNHLVVLTLWAFEMQGSQSQSVLAQTTYTWRPPLNGYLPPFIPIEVQPPFPQWRRR